MAPRVSLALRARAWSDPQILSPAPSKQERALGSPPTLRPSTKPCSTCQVLQPPPPIFSLAQNPSRIRTENWGSRRQNEARLVSSSWKDLRLGARLALHQFGSELFFFLRDVSGRFCPHSVPRTTRPSWGDRMEKGEQGSDLPDLLLRQPGSPQSVPRTFAPPWLWILPHVP